MKTARTLAFATLILFVALCASLSANDNDDWKNVARPSDYKPYSVISAGTAFRIDDMAELNVAPTFRIQYLRYQSSVIGLKFGLAYNYSTKINTDFRYYTGYSPDVPTIRHFTVDAGFRGRFARKLISPYLEAGFQFHRYWVASSGIGDSKAGINFGAGTEVRLSKKMSLDLNVNHTINHVHEPVYFEPLMPGGGVDVVYPVAPFSNVIYNPTELSVSLAHKL